jgi:hypothetical protein
MGRLIARIIRGLRFRRLTEEEWDTPEFEMDTCDQHGGTFYGQGYGCGACRPNVLTFCSAVCVEAHVKRVHFGADN